MAIHYDVYVDNINMDFGDKSTFTAFSRECEGCCGARVIFNPDTGRSRGFGYVSFT
jgi:RNA recognition motif-containing protein